MYLIQEKRFVTNFIVRILLLRMSKRKRSSTTLAILTTSSVEEVCEWAGRAVTAGGVGLDSDDVAILRREKIKGTNLFTLTDKELKEDSMSRGARKDLLAAVTLLREPPGEDLAFNVCSVWLT